MGKHQSPENLADAVHSELERRYSSSPTLEVLTELFEAMYFVSLTTEEAQPIRFHIVYIDPDDPDPDPPSRIVKDRWSCVRLAQSITVSIPNLVKIAKASDPRTSSFAVFHDKKRRLFIWGLIDQGNRYHDFVNYESETGPERPGSFQASITGIGHLTAYIGYEKIAELKVNYLLNKASDVFEGGPVLNILKPGIQNYLKSVETKLPQNTRHLLDEDWANALSSFWTQSLCRLLLRVQNYHHGGAVLITPDTSFDGLNVKYQIEYGRLQSALVTRALAQIQANHATDQIFGEYIEQSADEIPIELFLEEGVHNIDLRENRSEIDGVIWFISLLTQVDGLVLMNQNLEVHGFGVEITVSEEPYSVSIATSRSGSKSRLRNIDYTHYGTRHRSMIRYCSRVPGSIGFVVSQDGDVRAMTSVNGQLILWDNIKLQYHHFIRRRKEKKKTS